MSAPKVKNNISVPDSFEYYNGISIKTGIGSPEGVVTAPLGSKYIDSVTSTEYKKENGIGFLKNLKLKGIKPQFRRNTVRSITKLLIVVSPLVSLVTAHVDALMAKNTNNGI